MDLENFLRLIKIKEDCEVKLFLSTAFLITLYGFFSVFCFIHNKILLALSGLILLAVSIINIVFSIIIAISTQNLPKVRNEMRKIMLFIKLLSIPFFIINFAIWTGVVGTVSLFPGGLLIWIFVPIIVFLTFIILLVTSSFSISTVILYGRSKLLNKHEIIIHILLQLIFVIDVFDAMFLFCILGKKDLNKNELNF